MSSKRDGRGYSEKTALERDVERTITDLLVGKDVREPIRVGKKIIQTGDSQTTITYELTVNPNTGQQEVVERISTNKKECSTCGSYVSQLYTCSLCGKQGISKGYEEIEENARTVRQRILVMQNIRKNTVVKDRVFCRFSEFTSDVAENQIIKFALYQISRMPLRNSETMRRARSLARQLQQVTLTPISAANFPHVRFNRLNEHYRTVVNLAKLIIEHCTLDLQANGQIRYSSYLVDMNVLFQKFLYSYLKNTLENYSVKETPLYDWDEEGRFELIPDIVVRKSGHDILAIDAKWKRRQDEEGRPRTATDDMKQMFLYCDRLKLPIGVLVYPKHEASLDDERPVKVKGITLLTKTIDLTKEKERFDHECDDFVREIGRLAEDTERHAITQAILK